MIHLALGITLLLHGCTKDYVPLILSLAYGYQFSYLFSHHCLLHISLSLWHLLDASQSVSLYCCFHFLLPAYLGESPWATLCVLLVASGPPLLISLL